MVDLEEVLWIQVVTLFKLSTSLHFCGNRKLMNVCTNFCQWPLFVASLIQSIHSHHIHVRSFLILSFHLRLFFTFSLVSDQNFECISHFFLIGEGRKIEVLHYVIFSSPIFISSLMGLNAFISTCFTLSIPNVIAKYKLVCKIDMEQWETIYG